MSNQSDHVRVGEVSRRGDFYRINGKDKEGRVGSVEIPVQTLDKLPRKDAEALMRRGVYGTIHSERD